MKKSLIVITLIVISLMINGCSGKNDVDMNNINSKTGIIIESVNTEVPVNIVSSISDLKIIGIDEEIIEPSSSRKTHTWIGTIMFGVIVGPSIGYGTSTLLNDHYVEASKIKIKTNDNELYEAYVQIKDLPNNLTVNFEKPIDKDEKIELIQLIKKNND